MARKKTVAPKRAYTKGGQPFTAADLRALEKAIDIATAWSLDDEILDDEILAARQALRNARELRTHLLRAGLEHFVT